MSNKRPIRALFDDIHNLTAEEIESSNILKDLLKNEIPKCIKQAHKNKKTYASIFEINSSNQFIEIHKKDFISALESCVVLNVEDENYEVCSEISELIQEIKTSKRTQKVKLLKND